VAITGASGSIYARQLLTKLEQLKDHCRDTAVVITENAKQVWQTELDSNDYADFNVKYYTNQDLLLLPLARPI
jgi:4-hydroxy-3-polyprenylbenzoate decarboxylase